LGWPWRLNSGVARYDLSLSHCHFFLEFSRVPFHKLLNFLLSNTMLKAIPQVDDFDQFFLPFWLNTENRG
jgi:hypothetical protein